MTPEEAEERIRRAEEASRARGNGPDHGSADDNGAKPLGVPITAASLADKEPEETRFAIADHIPEAVPGICYGNGGLYKTWSGLQAQVTHDLDPEKYKPEFLGLAVKHGPTIGLYCESDEREARYRLHSIAESFHCPLRELVNVHLWPRLGERNTLFAPNSRYTGIEPTGLFWELGEHARKVQAIGIWIDGIGAIYTGERSIDPAQISEVMRHHFALLCRESGSYLCLFGHPSRTAIRTSDPSGGWSTEWWNASRFVLGITAEGTSDGKLTKDGWLKLTREKCNGAPQHYTDPIIYRLTDGRLRCKPTGIFAAAEDHRAEELVLEAIRRFNDTGQEVARSSSAHTHLAALLKNSPSIHPGAAKLGKPGIFGAIERLLAEQKRLEIYKNSKGYVFLRVAEKEDD